MKRFLDALKESCSRAFSFSPIVGFLFWASTTINLLLSGSDLGFYGSIVLNVMMGVIIFNMAVINYKDD